MEKVQKASFTQLEGELSQFGMAILGGFELEAEDQLEGACLLIIANAGSAIWTPFQASDEALDGRADPMNRWSQRVLGNLAKKIGARALFPFEGPPYHPFQRWSARARQGVRASPIGIAIHPEWGLWWALRAALVLPESLEIPFNPKQNPACDSCSDQPCLQACPVSAFKIGCYDVEACAEHIQSKDANCEQGCLARHACPIGQDFRYEPEHAKFHMRAFSRSRSAKPGIAN